MLRAYVNDDLTLAQIGIYHGLSRERVRQILTKEDPTLYALAKRRRRGRTRLAVFVRNAEPPQSCRLCGGPAGTNRTSFCGQAHVQGWFALRYQHDTHYREGQRQRSRDVATTNLGPEHPLWEHAGMQPGSVAWHWGLRAVALGWPIIDRFRPEVRAQLEAALGRNT